MPSRQTSQELAVTEREHFARATRLENERRARQRLWVASEDGQAVTNAVMQRDAEEPAGAGTRRAPPQRRGITALAPLERMAAASARVAQLVRCPRAEPPAEVTVRDRHGRPTGVMERRPITEPAVPASRAAGGGRGARLPSRLPSRQQSAGRALTEGELLDLLRGTHLLA